MTVYPAEPARAALVLAHGAGAGQASPFMVRAARGLAARGVTAATFDFPYMAAGRKMPDRADVLERSWIESLDQARRAFPGLTVFAGGKSMGGRMASQAVAGRGLDVAGLVFLGYPLHPPGRPGQRRDAHLPGIAWPMLFVQGTRDAFGTADEIRALLPRLNAARLHAVDGGDHSFRVTGPGAPAPDAVLGSVLDAIRDWMHGILAGAPR